MQKTYQAAIYLRLSREDGDVTEGGKQVSNSIANQKELVMDYLKSHPEIQIADTYVDDGFSGVDFERPEFQRMLSDIRENKINFGTYYYQEFEAPEGYEVNDDKYEFTITEDGQIVSVIMTNKAIPEETPEKPKEDPKEDTPTETPKTPTSTEGPKTGDDADVALWAILAGIAAAVGIGLTAVSIVGKKRKKGK